MKTLIKKEKIGNYKIELKKTKAGLSIIAYKGYNIENKIHYTIFQGTFVQNDIFYGLSIFYSFCNDILNQIQIDNNKAKIENSHQ